MALDTAEKRGSAVHVGLPWRTWLAVPDGTIDASDRASLAGQYSGSFDAGGGGGGGSSPTSGAHQGTRKSLRPGRYT